MTLLQEVALAVKAKLDLKVDKVVGKQLSTEDFSTAEKVKLAAITNNTATATALETARLINGVSFDGTADIVINVVDATPRIASSLIGVANGVAPLSAANLIPSEYLPSYVDDVIESATFADLPAVGEVGKIYVDLDTNKAYRWSGSIYIHITSGAVDSVAGKTGVVTLVKADVGLGNVDNTSDLLKPLSNDAVNALALKADAALYYTKAETGTVAEFATSLG
jgi:hypothetical protein